MPNFYDDNPDLQFQLAQAPLAAIAALREDGFGEAAEFPFAPADAAEAIENYIETCRIVGEVAGDFVAPRAEDVDLEGPTLADGVVTYPTGIQEALDRLADADLMGFTLPRRYGGLNIPHTLYAAAIEMVSRADAGLMTIFGLQDIAETILNYGSDEQKDNYLPRFARGEVTGAMALTEPDAGSDLQAVQLKARPSPDDPDVWLLNGVKRFITNGCGDVLLVLARSEEGSRDGRGLSCFIAEKCPELRVRRIEDKLGIHGSPTCELQFDNVPATLVGQRRRGLIRYVMSLMNGARLAIAAQSVGIAEAAYREALAYAREREQFGKAILHFPPVAEMLCGMKLKLHLARTLTIDCAVAVDYEREYEKRAADRETRAQFKPLHRRWSALASALTPMAKYYASEAAIDLANTALQVLGGSGYMRDYPVERLVRDARITNIYEGTSQLQVVAINVGVLGSGLASRLEELAEHDYAHAGHAAAVTTAHERLTQAVAFVKGRGERDYTDLVARHLADMAIDVYGGYRLLQQAEVRDEDAVLADLFVPAMARRVEHAAQTVLSGQRTLLDSYHRLLGI